MQALPLQLVLALPGCEQSEVRDAVLDVGDEVEQASQELASEGQDLARTVDRELSSGLEQLDDALQHDDHGAFERQADHAITDIERWIAERRAELKQAGKTDPVLDEAEAQVQQLRADLHDLGDQTEEAWKEGAEELREALRDLENDLNAATRR